MGDNSLQQKKEILNEITSLSNKKREINQNDDLYYSVTHPFVVTFFFKELDFSFALINSVNVF